MHRVSAVPYFRKRLRGYVLTRFLAVPYFCPWKCQEQITWEQKKLEQLANQGIA